ncbi:MAG TPA: hypothetical protein VNO30_39065 [Kofleriaceae bacterium]|nr:hypothetical protein [Kofleriaceae bacterium]
MNGCTASLLLAALGLVACGGDDAVQGAHGQCAFGGELNDCPDAERTPEGACWRLVDCGAIPIAYENPDDPNDRRFDWGQCVDYIAGRTDDRQRIMINCIAASVCDELRVFGSPEDPNRNDIRCIRLGDP